VVAGIDPKRIAINCGGNLRTRLIQYSRADTRLETRPKMAVLLIGFPESNRYRFIYLGYCDTKSPQMIASNPTAFNITFCDDTDASASLQYMATCWYLLGLLFEVINYPYYFEITKR
jgi:hypothetical protein